MSLIRLPLILIAVLESCASIRDNLPDVCEADPTQYRLISDNGTGIYTKRINKLHINPYTFSDNAQDFVITGKGDLYNAQIILLTKDGCIQRRLLGTSQDKNQLFGCMDDLVSITLDLCGDSEDRLIGLDSFGNLYHITLDRDTNSLLIATIENTGNTLSGKLVSVPRKDRIPTVAILGDSSDGSLESQKISLIPNLIDCPANTPSLTQSTFSINDQNNHCDNQPIQAMTYLGTIHEGPVFKIVCSRYVFVDAVLMQSRQELVIVDGEIVDAQPDNIGDIIAMIPLYGLGTKNYFQQLCIQHIHDCVTTHDLCPDDIGPAEDNFDSPPEYKGTALIPLPPAPEEAVRTMNPRFGHQAVIPQVTVDPDEMKLDLFGKFMDLLHNDDDDDQDNEEEEGDDYEDVIGILEGTSYTETMAENERDSSDDSLSLFSSKDIWVSWVVFMFVNSLCIGCFIKWKNRERQSMAYDDEEESMDEPIP